MRGWKHLLVGFGFLAGAAVAVVADASFWTIALLLLASGFCFFQVVRGRVDAPGADLNLAFDFVRDPLDTIIDHTADALDNGRQQQEAPRSTAQGGVLQNFARELGLGADSEPAKPAFDPDAVIARYLADRPPTADPEPIAPVSAAAGFGRKGR